MSTRTFVLTQTNVTQTFGIPGQMSTCTFVLTRTFVLYRTFVLTRTHVTQTFSLPRQMSSRTNGLWKTVYPDNQPRTYVGASLTHLK